MEEEKNNSKEKEKKKTKKKEKKKEKINPQLDNYEVYDNGGCMFYFCVSISSIYESSFDSEKTSN